MSNVKPIAKGSNKKPLGIVLGVGNQKGGVGKSTNTTHIAAGLGEKGYKVLIIDLDPTAGSTKLLGVEPEEFSGTLELVIDREHVSELVIAEEMPEGVHLIPARTDMNVLDSRLPKIVDKIRLLEPGLEEARKIYDFILLDTQPSAGATLTISAYACADWFLFCVIPEPLAIAGLGEALRDIAQARKVLNKKLEILGIVVAKAKRTSTQWKEISDLVKNYLPGREFRTTISDSVAISRISGTGITLFQDKKLCKHKVCDEYRNLVAEIEHRAINKKEFITGKLKSKPQLLKISNS